MKTKVLLSVIVVAVIAALVYSYDRMSSERAADAEADQPIAAASRVQHGTNGETIITVNPKAQQLIALQTATLAAVTMRPAINAYGRVLDSAALVILQNEAFATRAASRAAQSEYERLKKLNAQDNASAYALETAEAEMKRDQAALATVEARLVAASGRAVADAPTGFFQSLARQECILVRLDVPAGELLAETPVGALVLPPGGGQPLEATFFGRAATTDPRMQGEGFLFAVTNAPAWLRPKLAVVGLLQLPGEELRGVVVPNDAVVRSNEHAWLYVQTGNTQFVRREITLNHPTSGGWFVTNDVAAGDKVVVTGAQALLSEEHKTEIKLED